MLRFSDHLRHFSIETRKATPPNRIANPPNNSVANKSVPPSSNTRPLGIQKPGATAASTTINKLVIVTASATSMMRLPIRTNSTTRTENLAEVYSLPLNYV